MNFKSLILILTFTLLLPQSGQSEFLHHPDDVQAVLQSANQRLEVAISISPEDFLRVRKEILNQLISIDVKKSWFWIKQVDEQFFEFYLLKSTEAWTQLPASNPSHALRLQLIERLNQKNISLSWLDTQFYGLKSQHGRGVTFASENMVSIEPIDQAQIHPVLAHELTHLFDTDLAAARGDLDALTPQIDRLYQKVESNWTTEDKEFFGRYWFLKRIYLPYYKELRPRINACLVTTDLTRLGVIKNGPDLERYKPVLNGTTSCQTLSHQELVNITGEPKPFWAANSFYGHVERAYLEQWLNIALQP